MDSYYINILYKQCLHTVYVSHPDPSLPQVSPFLRPVENRMTECYLVIFTYALQASLLWPLPVIYLQGANLAILLFKFDWNLGEQQR